MKRAPRLLVGHVGVGKTASIKAEFDGKISVEILSGWMPEDILGLPVAPKDAKGVVVRLRPDWHKRICDIAEGADRACLFFDELDKARRDVADAMLTLIEAREVGGYRLPDNVEIVAAANPPSCGGGDGISDAMRTRFRIVHFTPDLSLWEKWARKEFAGSAPANAVIDAICDGRFPLVDSHIGEDWTESRDATPRTWAYALAEITAGNYSPSGARSLLPLAFAEQAERIARDAATTEDETALDLARLSRKKVPVKRVNPIRF